MLNHQRLISLNQLAILLLLFVFLTYFSQSSQAAPPEQSTSQTRATNLFIQVPRPNVTLPDGNAVIRTNHVRINEPALFIPATFELQERISLNLFDDVRFTAVQKRIESNPSGSYTWIGTLEGVENSTVFLVYNDGVLVGKVSTVTAVYEIRYTTGNYHRVVEIDLAQLENEENDAIPVPPESGNSGQPLAITPSDDGSVLDVLVVYTPDAAINAGGTTAMENLIELGISETNQAYEQSGVNQRAFLVHMEQVTYTESGDQGIDLNLLRGTGDGFMDNVHALRNTYHADFVALIVYYASGGCGVGFVQSPAPDPGFVTSAFTVTRYDCITPNYTLAHEMGHNMGLNHDWYVSDSLTPFTHAHGYVNFANQWRTIMAYNDRCGNFGSFCSRLLYFSNPNNMLGGNPMGIPTGTSTACTAGSTVPDPSTCDADASQVLDVTAANNATFRTSSIIWTGNTNTDWNTASNWDDGIVPRFMDDVFVPTSPTGGVFPIGSGSLNARNVTIETGASVVMNGGTLNVYGHWEEQGTGTFTGTGGSVIFQGLIPQNVTSNSGSSFNDMQFGDGTGTTEVTLLSDIDINGNLTIANNADLYGGSNTIRIAGNWLDQGTSFEPETSTVIFDGTTQTVDKVTTSIILDEPFDEADGQPCCNSIYLPSGWIREQSAGVGFLGGDFGGSGGSAFRWNNSSDAWLFTTGMTLKPGITYEVEYTYRSLFGSTNSHSIYTGTGQTSADMSTQVSTVTTSSTTFNTQIDTFTVAAIDTYYLGLRSEQISGAGYALFGEIHLRARRDLTFYDLQVSSTGSAVFMQDVVVNNDLTVNSGGVMDLSTNDITVEGMVMNNGRIRQTKSVPALTTTEFLHITDNAGTTDKYFGTDITPQLSMGSTTVQVAGNQTGCTSNPADQLITRCFDVSPTIPQNATIRFWFTEAERNGQNASSLVVWHYDGSGWTEASSTSTYVRSEGGIACTSGGGTACYVEALDVLTYSPFVPGSSLAPTAVSLQQIRVGQANTSPIWFMLTFILSLSGLYVYSRRSDR